MTEEQMKKRLSQVLNNLLQIEVKGVSAIMLVDNIREIDQIIKTPLEENNEILNTES